MKLSLTLLMQQFSTPQRHYDFQFVGLDDLTRLAEIFHASTVTPILMGNNEGMQRAEVRIEVDGTQDLTHEQWMFLVGKTYQLHFLPPDPLIEHDPWEEGED